MDLLIKYEQIGLNNFRRRHLRTLCDKCKYLDLENGYCVETNTVFSKEEIKKEIKSVIFCSEFKRRLNGSKRQ